MTCFLAYFCLFVPPRFPLDSLVFAISNEIKIGVRASSISNSIEIYFFQMTISQEKYNIPNGKKGLFDLSYKFLLLWKVLFASLRLCVYIYFMKSQRRKKCLFCTLCVRLPTWWLIYLGLMANGMLSLSCSCCDVYLPGKHWERKKTISCFEWFVDVDIDVTVRCFDPLFYSPCSIT